MTEDERISAYLRYCIRKGAEERWGPDWVSEDPRRPIRLGYEINVIDTRMHFASYFLILKRILDWCREQKIVYGPGRGSVGGSLVAYCLGIHEVDSLEWDLSFERFLNPDRVAYPDVDIDVSQRHRPRVLEWIKSEFEDEHTVVLQVAAFARAGARRTIDMVAAAKRQDDPNAESIAVQLKKLLPEGANVTGGTKQAHEIAWWLENGHRRNREAFEELATKAGWMETLLKLDGVQTHLTQHAAGVVIMGRKDLARFPQTSYDGVNMMTGYDMYMLDNLGVLKIDILGLRTLDIVSDAHKFCGGDGTTPELMKLWRTHRDEDLEPYDLLCAADTTGVFQVETSGYRKTLKEFQPRTFDHIVQLNALYRPGALDSTREDGKNMVEVFIDRLHDREPIAYPAELSQVLPEVLGTTQGIILYQEQAMKLARLLAGFTETEADNLRKAIGKKQLDRMARIEPAFVKGMEERGYSAHAAAQQWAAIEAAGRYSWNLSHSVFYGAITWWTAFFKSMRQVEDPYLGLDGPGTAGFYAALINSLDGDKDRQADAVAEARQHVEITPPDINVAMDYYTVKDDSIVFGLNGIKGMGEANRNAIIVERFLSGPFTSFEDFHRRLPSVPINMKLSLIRCGAFDLTDGRAKLLAVIQKPNGKEWTVAEFIKHNTSLKKPRELPSITEWRFPTNRELADGEIETIGFYVSADPMKDVTQALRRLDPSCHLGGEVVAATIKTKADKNDNEMGWFTLLTSALNKQRCMVFASNWPQCKPLVLDSKGKHVVVRGHMDGSQWLVDRVFAAGDYRQFRVIELKKDGNRTVAEFNGKLETVELYEAEGYEVTLT